MRLADFIEGNTEPILAEWVEFASKSGPAGEQMDIEALRDHALSMLTVIVEDLRTPQTDTEQAEKSRGKADADGGDAETAAEVHGAGRAESGFTLDAMVAEYRALRASVIRLWTDENGTLTGDDFEDLMRFNEAIDQSLAESVTRYTKDIDRSKDMFVAILGHDLRTPLGAIMMSSQFMLELGELKEPHRTLTTRILRGSRRMNRMVGDLLDFTRSQLGSGVPITREAMDLGREAAHAVEEIKAYHPDSVMVLATTGNLQGEWDCARMSQVLTNLLGNAVQHGAPRSPVNISVRDEGSDVVLQVQNRGATIPPADIPGLFSPFKRLRAGDTQPNPSNNLGLGLYIAERVVTAHGGTIEVTSSDAAGTTFIVCLPRDPEAANPVKAASTSPEK